LHSPSLPPILKAIVTLHHHYLTLFHQFSGYGLGFNSSFIAAIKCEVMLLGYNWSKQVEGVKEGKKLKWL